MAEGEGDTPFRKEQVTPLLAELVLISFNPGGRMGLIHASA